MPDSLYLSLWFPDVEGPAMLPHILFGIAAVSFLRVYSWHHLYFGAAGFVE